MFTNKTSAKENLDTKLLKDMVDVNQSLMAFLERLGNSGPLVGLGSGFVESWVLQILDI